MRDCNSWSDRVWCVQKLNTAMEAYFDAADAERDTRNAYEVLLSKRRRGISYVSDADTTAGERRVKQTHAHLVSARSELQDMMELLAAFQSPTSPEVSFHLCVAADGVVWGGCRWFTQGRCNALTPSLRSEIVRDCTAVAKPLPRFLGSTSLIVPGCWCNEVSRCVRDRAEVANGVACVSDLGWLLVVRTTR